MFHLKKEIMSIIVEEIKTLLVSQKAALYYLLSEDEELKNYLISGNELFEELERRDAAFTNGEMRLTNRQELSTRLQSRRNGL
jgi:hypothetical protein